MASTTTAAARELRYHNGYVDGSLAHELDWTFREGELRHAGEAPRHQQTAQEKPKARTVAEPKVRVREKQRVSVFSVLGFAGVLAMAVLVILSYVQITMLSSDTVALKRQLSTLETEQVRLTARYEQIFDLASVQEAAEAAGMVKPGTSQICYVDLSVGDSAVVYRQEETTTLRRVLTGLNHGASAVKEYFE